MVMVLNKTWGGFSLPSAFCAQFGLSRYDGIERSDSRLVDFVKFHGGEYRGDGVVLRVVEIPNEVTDWEMDEYDGWESIIYVVDGKIHHA